MLVLHRSACCSAALAASAARAASSAAALAASAARAASAASASKAASAKGSKDDCAWFASKPYLHRRLGEVAGDGGLLRMKRI